MMFAVLRGHRGNLVDGAADVEHAFAAKFEKLQAKFDRACIGLLFNFVNDVSNGGVAPPRENSGRSSLTCDTLAAHGHRHVEVNRNIVLKHNEVVFAEPKILL